MTRGRGLLVTVFPPMRAGRDMSDGTRLGTVADGTGDGRVRVRPTRGEPGYGATSR
jgi:hypothetical protein